MSPATQEADFATYIVDHLVVQGCWQAATPADYDPEVALVPASGIASLPKRSAMRILNEFCQGGVLTLVRPGAGRPTAYMLTKLIELTEGRSLA